MKAPCKVIVRQAPCTKSFAKHLERTRLLEKGFLKYVI